MAPATESGVELLGSLRNILVPCVGVFSSSVDSGAGVADWPGTGEERNREAMGKRSSDSEGLVLKYSS